jgi:demethylmenaquinone methyltransferase/2-methoxy-6-polyprenyl-1,4-benzoquinol methylase
MLNQFRREASKRQLMDRLTLIQASVTQLDKHFSEESVDVVTSTMVLGEFPAEYLDYIFRHSRRLLRPGGRLFVADEVWPDSALGRIAARFVMAVVWIPQFLLLRRVTYPVSDLEGLIRHAGFSVEHVDRWAGSSFRLIHAYKSPVTPELADVANAQTREAALP